jgi:hypothetical protein
MKSDYSNQLCIKCHNDICKVYGGRCKQYKFLKFFKKLINYNKQKPNGCSKINNDTKLKEKCIYYNPVTNCYYLVLSISDMIYGRCGDMINPTYLDVYMNQDGTGLRFKIDDIIINKDYIRNYYLNDKVLDKFELVKELTDEEFYPMELLINSHYKYPSVIIDIHKHMHDVFDIVKTIRNKKSKVEKLKKDICTLEKKLFASMK